jgi:flagellar basal-body rod modification protein FlgD
MSENVALPSNIMTTDRVLKQKYEPQTTEQSLGRDAFLKLFTTQLKSQDPLSPMENEAFVSQLAQFSSLESMKAMQSSIEKMTLGMQKERMISGANMLGRSIPSSTGSLVGGESRLSEIRSSLPKGADNVTFSIKNASGKVVFEQSYGRQPPSDDITFKWDGTDGAGEPLPLSVYYASVYAQQNGQAWTAPVTTQDLIKSVRWDKSASDILIETETGKKINLAQLEQIEL